MKLGDKIRIIRESKNLEAKYVAEKAKITKAYLSQIENNVRKNPSTKVLNKIADALEVSVDEFFKSDDSASKSITIVDTVAESTTEYNPQLTKKDEKDIEKILDNTLESLEKQDGLMLQGELVDEEDWELLKMAIKNGLEYAKLSNKKKYTPKKYR